jgi:hypothetical protein
MLAALMVIVAALQSLGLAVAAVWALVSVVRDRPATPEELERALMRSLSWPGSGDHFNGER